MTASPIVCTNVRRNLKGGAIVAGVTLRIPGWRVTALGGVWLRNAGGERIVLPRREWVEPAGVRRVADIFVFDDWEAQERFERTALAAARRLIKAATR